MLESMAGPPSTPCLSASSTLLCLRYAHTLGKNGETFSTGSPGDNGLYNTGRAENSKLRVLDIFRNALSEDALLHEIPMGS